MGSGTLLCVCMLFCVKIIKSSCSLTILTIDYPAWTWVAITVIVCTPGPWPRLGACVGAWVSQLLSPTPLISYVTMWLNGLR
jgi:hypothetical protein